MKKAKTLYFYQLTFSEKEIELLEHILKRSIKPILDGEGRFIYNKKNVERVKKMLKEIKKAKEIK